MKIKYLRLSKEDKLKAKKNFYKTKKGMNVYKNLKNAQICAVLCLIYSLFLFIEYFIKKTDISNLIMAIVTLGFGIASLMVAHKIFITNVNEYVINNKY